MSVPESECTRLSCIGCRESCSARANQGRQQPTPAGACFQRALAAARRQGARTLELRAAMSLRRLLEHADGRAREEAHRTLADVYTTFKSGFDTADLREARALLTSPL